MTIYCSECAAEIDSENVLVERVLAMTEGEVMTLVLKSPIRMLCFGCAAELPLELKERFNGKVDGKIQALVNDFRNFMQHGDENGMDNIVTFLREGINLYFGYDAATQRFFAGELIQLRLLTVEEVAAMPEGTNEILENISNHVYVTTTGEAFTLQGESTQCC